MACANSSTDPEQDSSLYLADDHRDVTILALRMSSRKKLGMYLNNEALPLPNGQLPNYGGLAECIGFEYIEQQSFERERDPTQALLREWGNRPELNPTLGNLVDYLLELGRLDLLEDCKEIIHKDAEHYLKKRAASSSEISPVQDSTVSQSPFNIDDMTVDETTIMTIQDVEAGGPTYYDAFVCYHPEGEDLEFVKTMIEKMECQPHNLRLFVPHRDDLPGASKYVISAKLIQDRCKRMVIVMSPRYLRSAACDFQTKFAHALSPGSRSKKLVPVRVKECETPNILRHVTTCDYTRGDMTGWFWNRLIKSLQAPLNPHEITVENPSSLSRLEMSFESQSTCFSSLSSDRSSTPSREGQTPFSALLRSGSGSSLAQPTSRATVALPAASNHPLPSACEGGASAPKTGGRAVTCPLSSSTGSSAPSSPNTNRKAATKKKGLRSKLSSILSSSHSSSL